MSRKTYTKTARETSTVAVIDRTTDTTTGTTIDTDNHNRNHVPQYSRLRCKKYMFY